MVHHKHIQCSCVHRRACLLLPKYNIVNALANGSQVQPVSRDVDEELRRFTDKMPAVAAIKGGKSEKAAAKKEKGGDAKKKKK